MLPRERSGGEVTLDRSQNRGGFREAAKAARDARQAAEPARWFFVTRAAAT
jgi:hypothetical protein